jgi:ketosteroid isomerase-like protein
MRALTLIGIAVGSLIGGLGLLVAADEARAETQVEQELLQLEQEWADALVRSDTTKLGHIMAEGWEAIIPSGEVWTKETFLMLLKTGALAIESAESADVKVRVYGDAAVVRGQGIVKGKYKGIAFISDERWTDVFVKKNGRWQCVASQVTRIAR